jgi:acetylornithine deacetylase/succinyl-diaminopimelate desuccinylase-like protein
MTRRLGMLRLAAAAAAVFLCAGCGPKPPISAALPGHNELMAELACAPQEDSERAEMAARLFRQAGLKDVVRQEIHEKETGRNIIGTLAGRTQNVIVVGAHFDHTPGSGGVIDDWTGVVCMANIAQALAKARPQHTFIFIAFDLEEHYLVGSRWYVLHLADEQKRRIAAMVDLECLGVSGLKVWRTGSADALEQLAADVARQEKYPLSLKRSGGVAADSDCFMAAGIPAITFHSLDPQDFDLANSPNDRIEAVRPDQFEQQCRFILKFLQALDGRSGPIPAANLDRPAPQPRP